MSTTRSPQIANAVAGCRPEDATPVRIDAESLDSITPDYLRTLKDEFTTEGLVPARLTVETCFDADCPFDTQDEIDRVRDYVRAAAFLGAGTVTVSFDTVADERTVRPALAACAERAYREGVTLDLDGPLSLEY